MFRLAHISDPHLGPLPKIAARQLLSKRFTGYINWRRNRSNPEHSNLYDHLVTYTKTLKPDHLVITGDLVNLGLPEEIKNAQKWLQKLGNPSDSTIVCGNHDAYVRGSLHEAFRKWQDWLIGDDASRVYKNRDFPTVRRRGDISIISCNSAIASPLFMAVGMFGKKQRNRLKKILADEKEKGRCRVVLIHHPPFRNATYRHKRLIGISRFMEAIASEGAELVLHGHTHLSTLEYIPGSEKKVPVVCVPAAYQWPNDSRPASGVNIFEIARNDKNWDITLERHGMDILGKFVPLKKLTL